MFGYVGSRLSVVALFFVSLGVCAAPFGADRHAEKGVACTSCHGAKQEIAVPSIDQCKKCHDPKAVAEKTKSVKPQNPHVSPHYGTELDCALCHLQHDKPENYCNQCHQFNFTVR